MQNRNQLLRVGKVIGCLTLALIPPALTIYWILILAGVRRYDANLAAFVADPPEEELIACSALSNPSSFQLWESLTQTLPAINYFCHSQMTMSEFLSVLQSACRTFKSNVPCNSKNGGVTDYISFCGHTTFSPNPSDDADPSLASITCQYSPNIDNAVKYFFDPIAALYTLLMLCIGSTYLVACCSALHAKLRRHHEPEATALLNNAA